MSRKVYIDLLPGLLLSLLLVAAISYFYVRTNKDFQLAYKKLENTQNRMLLLENIYSAMMDAETGQRGYLLTGNEIYLETYTNAPDSVNMYLSAFDSLDRLGSKPHTDLSQLKALIKERFALMQGSIDIMKSEGREVAENRIRAGQGRRVMVEIRRVIRDINHIETTNLHKHYAEVEEASRMNYYSMLMAVALTSLVLGFWLRKLLLNNRTLYKQNESLISARAELEHKNHQLKQAQDELKLINDNLERIVEERTLALYESEERLEFLADFMPQLVWRTEPNGDHDYFNKRWYEYTGLSYEETKDKGWSLVLHPDDYERTLKVWHHSLETGEPYDIEYRFRRFDGVYRWFIGRALPLRNEQGNIVKWFGTCTDIHDQKTSKNKLELLINERTKDLLKANEELTRSNSELEQFAYVASHDLQEPLRKIQAFGDRLSQKYVMQLPAEGQDYISRMQNASARMQILINDLLNFSRASRSRNEFVKVDLNNVLKEAIANVEASITESQAEISIDRMPELMGDARQLTQLFQNLISNSIKFRKEEVQPKISITCQMADKQEIAERGLDNHDNYFLIKVTDNGIGFENKHAEKIFTIFQRLHGRTEYEGTGIGLAICRKVVENHRGKIYVESTLNVGTTFFILLPETAKVVNDGQIFINKLA
ncbi:MAG: CHASE3 domain-containing protein [Chitinophagales bacterium]|nr:CHASE3 domain-containing protein [Chitinophagales bacterium]